MRKFNLRSIMLRAWKLFRSHRELGFAECLHRAWISEKAVEINAERIEKAKKAAGITELTNTWSQWKELGYENRYMNKEELAVLLNVNLGYETN